jgi:hypothetical protein
MTTARDIMTPDVTCVGEKETLADAAHKMAELGVGSLPICGEDNRLKGMVTDRDIVVRALAKDRDPRQVTAGELGGGKPVTIGAADDAAEILRTTRGPCRTARSAISWTPCRSSSSAGPARCRTTPAPGPVRSSFCRCPVARPDMRRSWTADRQATCRVIC